MSKKEKLNDEARALVVQRHQLDAAGLQIGKIGLALDQLGRAQQDNDALLDQMLAQAEAMLESGEMLIEIDTARAVYTDVLLDPDLPAASAGMRPLGMLDSIAVDRHADWNT